MISKQVMPESFDFGMPSVEIVNVGSKGLDKTAMVKRASAFDDVLDKIEKRANRTYLHVITTGAYEKYGANANCFPGSTRVICETGEVDIAHLKVGTKVLTKEGSYHIVVRKFMRAFTGNLITVEIKDGTKVTMTDNHPVFVVTNKKTKAGEYVEAAQLKKGDTLLLKLPKEKNIAIDSVTVTPIEKEIVYNLEVEDSHTFCVPFVVHNCDAWNGRAFDHVAPYPEDEQHKVAHFDGGLSKYHDDTYMKGGAVYQEHQTKSAGVDPSGEIVAARYNEPMQRGELLIAVDNDKWRDRLQKKASGKDIYLSIGASVPHDTCFPKGTLVLTEYGYRAIENIGVGDIVRANDGNWYQVRATSARYTTQLTRLHTMGFPIEIECTPNHPIKVVSSDKWLSCHGSTSGGRKRRHTTNGSGVCTSCGKVVDTTAEWVSAKDIQMDDYLKIKIDDNADVNTVGESFAYLCGMYLGDGSIISEPTGNDSNKEDSCLAAAGINISASADEKDTDILERIVDCFRRVTGKTASIHKESNGKRAYVVSLYDKLFMSRVYDLCGIGSKTKHIAADIFGWSKTEKEAFLAGYIDADGCVTPTAHVVRTCSVNRGLSLGIQRLMWSVGLPANCYIGSSEENARKNSAFGSYSCCYAVSTRSFSAGLCAQSSKLSRNRELIDAKPRGGNTVVLDGGYAYIRVNGINTFDCDQVMVYNLEVDGDHTYNAEGADVHNCILCGRVAKTADQHCDHFKRHRGQLYDCGLTACVMNDSPSFYDISGVDVPADRIAFVLRKMASTEKTLAKTASAEAITTLGSRPPMLLTKAATILSKLAEMEKKIEGIIEGDKDVDLEAFRDDDDAKDDFILRVENYPADEIIDSCNRKGVLLSPKMLFKILGNDLEDGNMLEKCDDECCGDTSCMMRELEDDEDKNTELLDGSFDQHLPADLNLDEILNKFLPELGATDGAINAKVIKITISPRTKKEQKKTASFNKEAQQALRRTYARYLISFAERNNDQTCFNALMKVAALRK